MTALIVMVAVLGAVGCTKTVPPDTDAIKYVNRHEPGKRLNFDGYMFVPDKVNVLYFYADW